MYYRHKLTEGAFAKLHSEKNQTYLFMGALQVCTLLGLRGLETVDILGVLEMPDCETLDLKSVSDHSSALPASGESILNAQRLIDIAFYLKIIARKQNDNQLIKTWVHTENKYLEGKKPIDLIRSGDEGIKAVLQFLVTFVAEYDLQEEKERSAKGGDEEYEELFLLDRLELF